MSLLSGDKDSNIGDCHWFTATPSPGRSIFKPFRFDSRSAVAAAASSFKATTCHGERKDVAGPDNRQHQLWEAHAQQRDAGPSLKQLSALEVKYIELGLQRGQQQQQSGRDLFAEAVAEELQLYQ